ncbi:MAG: ATP-dependent Clp protease adaptor ClpS [Phycisphaerales bacterium]|nr:MAG: ATP-dependent Clp protease adaptor ClpS [Phycisphaerales bacterium]
MTMTMEAVVEQTKQATKVVTGKEQRPKKRPGYHVILLDDDDHTYDYVIGMLRKLFGYATETAFQLASEVDQTGRVIVDTTTLERAELKRDQIVAFGRDWRIARCEGSMSALIEPAPE